MTPARWYALELTVPAEASEVIAAWLWDYPLTGVEEDPEDPGRLIAFSAEPFDPDRAREEAFGWVRRVMGARAFTLSVRAFTVDEEDWLRAWKRDWRPTPLGERLVVAPAWWDGELPAGRVPVWIEPGRAFGTGTHLSTALAWEILEGLVLESPPRRLLDLGTGSGILSVGAAALAPSLHAVGTEADPGALPALRENLERNRAGERVAAVRTGGLPFAPGAFDAAVVNLTEREHRGVEVALRNAVAPGGTIILSGLRDEQVESARARWREAGLDGGPRLSRGGWTALAWRRPLPARAR